MMKKYVVGIIIGAALAFSGQAMAETISNVGKKIDSEYPIVVDGKTLDTKAIVVDGVSNTPNRALAEAVGYDVAFKDSTVYFTKQEETTIEPGADVVVETTPKVVDGSRTYTLENIDEVISSYEGRLRIERIIVSESKPTDSNYTEIIEGLKNLEAKLERFKAIKTELEAQQ